MQIEYFIVCPFEGIVLDYLDFYFIFLPFFLENKFLNFKTRNSREAWGEKKATFTCCCK